MIFEKRPDGEKREKKETDTYELLDKLKIPYSRADHEEAATIEACAEAEKLLGAPVCKNLFLCNTQKTNFYLLMMPGDKKFLTKELSKQIGSARLSFGDAGHMEQYLDIKPGSLSVLGLMNDREKHVKLLIDRDILKNEYFGCHPCVNTSSLKLKISDLLQKFLPYTGHEPTFVEL
ncbi:MAG: prolyl-tRNA synthetase associated domain-containing protein [Bacillota bacterium]|nr:prolyl-tRNA synthetase associated domain-containing protein [Bacillota bacterium]